MVLPLQRVGCAALVAFDVEKVLFGFEEGREARACKSDLFEDHG